MNRLDVEFACLSRPGRWLWILAGVALVAASLFAAVRSHYAGTVADLQRRLQQASSQAQVERAEAFTVRSESPRLAQYHDSAARMLRERMIGWPEMLALLEQVKMDGVTVTAVSVDAGERRGGLEIVSSDHAALDRYVVAVSSRMKGAQLGTTTLVQASLDSGSGSVRAQLLVSFGQ